MQARGEADTCDAYNGDAFQSCPRADARDPRPQGRERRDALRFEKRLVPNLRALAVAPPYFHQTTEFTCGPACMMMALAWADRKFKPAPAFEFQLWREATTICTGAGPGGCEPFGTALTLK